jgi:hypothetical protein
LAKGKFVPLLSETPLKEQGEFFCAYVNNEICGWKSVLLI